MFTILGIFLYLSILALMVVRILWCLVALRGGRRGRIGLQKVAVSWVSQNISPETGYAVIKSFTEVGDM